MNAQNCRMKYAPVAWKASVACGRWSLSKVVTGTAGRLTGDQAVIVPIIIVSRLCRARIG